MELLPGAPGPLKTADTPHRIAAGIEALSTVEIADRAEKEGMWRAENLRC